MKRRIDIIVLLSVFVFLFSGCMLTDEVLPSLDTVKVTLSTVNADTVIPTLKDIEPEDISYIVVSRYNDLKSITDLTDIAANLAALQGIQLTEKSSLEIQKDPTFKIYLKNGEMIEILAGTGLVNYGMDTYSYNESGNPTLSGKVFLVTNGKTYEPIVIGLYSSIGGLCADVVPFEQNNDTDFMAKLEEADTITYADDFAFHCVWDFAADQVSTPSYFVYDNNRIRISDNGTALTLPEEPGLYYVVLHASWGTSLSYEGSQYIFKIERG